MAMTIEPSGESGENTFVGIFSVTKIDIEKVMTKGATFRTDMQLLVRNARQEHVVMGKE